MKTFLQTLPLIILIALCTPTHSSIQNEHEIIISYQNDQLVVENTLFKRIYRCDSTRSVNYFYPISWSMSTDNVELLAGNNDRWFEFSINDTLISSAQGGWKYQEHIVRELENGGRELIVLLQGDGSIYEFQKNIILRYFLQIFPNSSIVREKLQIQSGGSENVYLSLDAGQINLGFPIYSFRSGSRIPLATREINLAVWEGEILEDIDWNLRPNDRLQLSDGKSGRNLAQNHMYHPRIKNDSIAPGKAATEISGPISILASEQGPGYIVAYEHGAPDDDMEQEYLKIRHRKSEGQLNTEVRAVRGAYYNGEPITEEKPYNTVWVDVGFFDGRTTDKGQEIFWQFLYRFQSEHTAPRMPTIYYNTWGMQRDEQKEKDLIPQMVLTEERILHEIGYAHELGVTVFVIDDGWQNYFGDWQPVGDRFPNGFMRIKNKLDGYNMRMGLWMAAEGIDPNSNLHKSHPEWLVRNIEGKEEIGRWNKPIGCFSSDYKSYFINLCKQLIDQGFTYFKWDGLDKHLCFSADHYHGDHSVPPEQRAERSGYDFILAITDVAREITEYNPDVVIVYDMTEELRNVGLAFLSEARFFWINNGATWYDELGYYRAKSIRTVSSVYNQIIPAVLQTSANYPHQSEMFGAQRYNVNTTLLGGGGFWGDLSEMEPADRANAGEVVRQYMKVAKSVVSTRPIVTGKIGSSPEIYEFIDPQRSEGQVIAFSGSAMRTQYKTRSLAKQEFFCALRNAYKFDTDGSLLLEFVFPQPDATNEVFVLSNGQVNARIESSTCWLKDAWTVGSNSFGYINGAPGTQVIFWPGTLGEPAIESSDDRGNTKIEVKKSDSDYRIVIEEKIPEITIRIAGRE